MDISSVLVNNGQTTSYKSSCSYDMPCCHMHNHNELLFLLSGRLQVENNLEVVEVDAPAVILHNSYTLHRATLTDGHYKRFIINFDDNTLNTVAPLAQTVRFFKNSNMTVIRLTHEMEEILQHYTERYLALSPDDGSRDTLTCLLLYELAKYHSPENDLLGQNKAPYINNVMQYIVQHYNEPITLDTLATRFYISRAKLTADFSSSTNMTIKQFTTLVRMNMAYSMIKGGATIADAARACGYNSIANFSATFSKYFGDAPAQYKQTAYSMKITPDTHTCTS